MANTGPGKIPPRWLHCPRKGAIMSGDTPFLPFKVPLDLKFNDQVPPENRFNLEMLIEGVEDQSRELGLVIDLCKTDRFYDNKEFEKKGIKYVKIQCAGFEEVPGPEQVNKFIICCKAFWKLNPLKVIGVHCTHGFNRTGYLIMSYLIKEKSMHVEAAFETFKKSRAPGIYKGHYIDELCTRYGDGSSGSMCAPEMPDWCLESDDSVDDEGEGQSRKRRKMNDGGGKFMDGIDGIDPVPAQLLRELQKTQSELAGKKGLGFSGSQPVSLDVNNIELLHQMPYNVSWKADGVRYMMMILGENQVYMIDRDNNVFKVPKVRFVSRKDISVHVTRTLIDGEMVIDKDGDNNIPRYLIYDVVNFEGKPVGQKNQDERLMIVQKELVEPRTHGIKKGLIPRHEEPFSIRKKDFWPISKTKWVLETFMPTLTHENDGVIVAPIMKPYTLGTCKEMMKWKPGNLNSVDFLLHVEENKPKPGQLKQKIGKLFVGGMETPFASVKATKKIRDLHRKIVECVWKNNTWEVLRIREDKSFPNSFNTAQSVCYSIQNPVTKDNLLMYIDKKGWRPPPRQQAPANPDQRLMPPPNLPGQARGPETAPAQATNGATHANGAANGEASGAVKAP